MKNTGGSAHTDTPTTAAPCTSLGRSGWLRRVPQRDTWVGPTTRTLCHWSLDLWRRRSCSDTGRLGTLDCHR